MGRQFTAVSQEEIVHFIKNNKNYFHDDNNKSLESSSHKSELINFFEGRVAFEQLSKVLQSPQTYTEMYLCGCAATLTFSGMYSAMDAAMDQTVTIYELEFFQRPPGAPSGWIYQASESGSQQMNVGETPIRFYSDVIHEIEQATDKHFGVNEKWREEHWRKFESPQSKELMIP